MPKLHIEIKTLNESSLQMLLDGLVRELNRREQQIKKDSELVAQRRAEQARLDALPPKYMHPSNRALAWSGEGRKPEWIDAWTAQGGTLYALEVAAEKMAPRSMPGSFSGDFNGKR